MIVRTVIAAMGFAILTTPREANAACIGVACSCSASATDLNFGTYDPLGPSDVSITSDIAVTCSALVAGLNVSYVIALDDGVHGAFAARKMSRGAETLSYNLYRDDGLVWGDGNGGTATVADAYLLALFSVTRHYTVHGTLPKAQNVGPGSYSDTITVTVTF